MVDRHWPCRNVYFRHSLAPAAGMAHVHQSFRRSHDAIRSFLRWYIPSDAPRAPAALLLADALPHPHGRLAAVPQSAGLGLLRRLDLRHGFAAVLVRGADPRPAGLSPLR